MNPVIIASLARHLLTAGGGVLVAKGTIDEATATSLIGALSTLFGFAWALFDKKGR